MEHAAYCLLELSGLSCADRSLKIWIFLDDIRKNGQGITLAKVVMQVACCLYQSKYVVFQDNTREGIFILTELCQNSVCIESCFQIITVFGGYRIYQIDYYLLTFLVEDI